MNCNRCGANPKFTEQQLKDWRAYERVRVRGNWNMITHSRHAAREAKLSLERYIFALENYSELKDENSANPPKPTPDESHQKAAKAVPKVPEGPFSLHALLPA